MQTKEKTILKQEFQIGDHVVYPLHGIGQIKDITEEEVLNQKNLYYVLELINKQMKILIPIEKVKDLGVRKVISKQYVKKVLDFLKENHTDIVVEEEWKVRYNNNLLKIKSGSIMDIAQVTQSLYKRARDKKLSIMEKKLYEIAYNLIVNEIAISKSITLENAKNLVSELLSNK